MPGGVPEEQRLGAKRGRVPWEALTAEERAPGGGWPGGRVKWGLASLRRPGWDCWGVSRRLHPRRGVFFLFDFPSSARSWLGGLENAEHQ